MLLVILSFPVLTATLALLFLDRYFGMHFFTADFGGHAMLYVNLIWIWGHPEVYILILPAFGIFSEIAATFCRKYLFGYVTMVWATASITVLSFVVWLHHFFTMGSGANVNAFFGIATMIISLFQQGSRFSTGYLPCIADELLLQHPCYGQWDSFQPS